MIYDTSTSELSTLLDEVKGARASLEASSNVRNQKIVALEAEITRLQSGLDAMSRKMGRPKRWQLLRPRRQPYAGARAAPAAALVEGATPRRWCW